MEACAELARAAAMEARDTVARPDTGIAGGERMGEKDCCPADGEDSSSPAAIRRTPSFKAAFAAEGIREETAGCESGDGPLVGGDDE